MRVVAHGRSIDVSRSPELQRLLARGPESFPDPLIVDVGALRRWVLEHQISVADAARALVEVCRRRPRPMMFFVGPTPVPSMLDGSAEAAQATAIVDRLLRWLVPPTDVVRSSEPLVGVLHASRPSPARIGIVTALLDEHSYETSVLDRPLELSLLDVANGRVWRYGKTPREPFLEPHLRAITGVEGNPGIDHVTRDAARYAAEIEKLLAGEPGSKVPKWVSHGIQTKQARIDLATAQLRGDAPADAPARLALDGWIADLESPPGRSGVYLAARVRRDGDVLTLDAVYGDVAGHHVAVGDQGRAAEVVRDAASNHRKARWVVPHALDLLGWMFDNNVPLPEHIVDPALSLFVSNPDAPPSCGSLSAGASLAVEEIAWLDDLGRDSVPTVTMPRIARVLRALDNDVAGVLGASAPVAEDDVARTLPALAKIERRGLSIGRPSGFLNLASARRHFTAELGRHEDRLRTDTRCEFLSCDVDALSVILRHLRRLYGIARPYCARHLSAKDRIAQMAAYGVPAAQALVAARSIKLASLRWIDAMVTSGGRLRGRSVPQVNGRVGYRHHDLQNLPKRSPEAAILRSAVVAPLGYVLVNADYDAFELRLLAAISGDVALLSACNDPGGDAHGANAAALLGGRSPELRARAKAGFLAIVYGQSKDGFHRSQPSLTTDEAAAEYNKFKSAFIGVDELAKVLRSRLKKSGRLDVPGGWVRRKRPSTAVTAKVGEATETVFAEPGWKDERAGVKPRDVLNATAQATAATILRLVLRELDAALTPNGAFLLHQVHDEVLVAAPEGNVEAVVTVMREVMEGAPAKLALPHPVPFCVKIKQGKRWSSVA